jgi:hypothetical protein
MPFHPFDLNVSPSQLQGSEYLLALDSRLGIRSTLESRRKMYISLILSLISVSYAVEFLAGIPSS